MNYISSSTYVRGIIQTSSALAVMTQYVKYAEDAEQKWATAKDAPFVTPTGSAGPARNTVRRKIFRGLVASDFTGRQKSRLLLTPTLLSLGYHLEGIITNSFPPR